MFATTSLRAPKEKTNALTYEAPGWYFLTRRDLAQAIAAFQKGIALDRNHTPFYNGMAIASLISGKPKRAIGYAEQALSLDPRGPTNCDVDVIPWPWHFFLATMTW